MIKPNFSVCEYFSANSFGSKLTAIRPPSKGKIGSKFSTISNKLMLIPASAISTKKMPALSGNKPATPCKKAQIIAMAKLESGPAAATQSISRLGLRKLRQLTGTGLAQPKAKPAVSLVNKGNKMVPNGSICRNGFNEIRPNLSAVSSPKCLAA